MNNKFKVFTDGVCVGEYPTHQSAMWHLFNKICPNELGLTKENHRKSVLEVFSIVEEDDSWLEEQHNVFCSHCEKETLHKWSDQERDLLSCQIKGCIGHTLP